jgi:hypothetical protein
MASEVFAMFVRAGDTEAWRDWICSKCEEIWESGL